MAGPPPYAPQKKSNTTTVILVILAICAVCCILGVGGFAVVGYMGFNKAKGMVACAIGFEEAGKAMQAYADDHKGTLPKAENWQEDIRPYFAKQLKQDEDQGAKLFGSFDAQGVWTCKDDGGGPGTGIAFNSDLSGAKLADIKNKSTTIVLFEVPKNGTNLNEPYVELSESQSPRVAGSPRGWFTVNANFKMPQNKTKNGINFGD